MDVRRCPYCDAPISSHEAAESTCSACGKKLPAAAPPAVGAPNRLGIGSLLGCAFACVFIQALMLARQAEDDSHRAGQSAAEYLWIVAPYCAVAIAAVIAWRSRFFSSWVLAGVVLATLANPAVYFLIYLALGGRENSSNTWYLFIGPVLMWNLLGVLLMAAGLVRLVQWLLARNK